MKVYVGQIYSQAGVSFPFSHLMQLWLGGELSRLASPSPAFEARYGADFSMVLRVNASTGAAATSINGPQVYRKDREVEFVVVLAYDVIMSSADGCRVAVRALLDGIEVVFARSGINCDRLRAERESLVSHICTDTTMLTEPWP